MSAHVKSKQKKARARAGARGSSRLLHWGRKHEDALAESIGSSILAGPGLNACGKIGQDCLGICLKSVHDVVTDAQGSVLLQFAPNIDFFRRTPTASDVGNPLKFSTVNGWNAHPVLWTLLQDGGSLLRCTSMVCRFVPTEPLVDRGGRLAAMVGPALAPDAVVKSAQVPYPGNQYVMYFNDDPFATTQQKPYWSMEDAANELVVLNPCAQPDALDFATYGESVLDNQPIVTRPDLYQQLAASYSTTLAFAGCTASTTIGFVEVCLCLQMDVGSTPGTTASVPDTLPLISMINTPAPPHPGVARALVDANSTVLEEVTHEGALAFRTLGAAHERIGDIARTAVREAFSGLGSMAKAAAPKALEYAMRYAATSLGRPSPPALMEEAPQLLLRASPLIEEVL